MKIFAICASVILLSIITSGPVARSQTKKRVPSGRRTRAVKPVSPTAKSSSVTTTLSGLTCVITRRSNGRHPRTGETVVVNYTGLLSNGVKFDSSLDRGQPFKFKLGEGRVIKGWDEGIEKLRVGEQATLVIPPRLGYGARGSGEVIPPDSTLIFVVELIGIEEPPA
ncbi:FKBP-type peptidyl-prolyl cis-trans isomerase [soil metagenome]